MVDYFGQYRDPLWDRMDEWKAEMEAMRTAIPDLQQQVENVAKELAKEKRKTAAFEVYKGQDPDVTVRKSNLNHLFYSNQPFFEIQDAIGYKFLVQKLSGFAKFELDTKITKLQFFHLVEESSMVEAG